MSIPDPGPASGHAPGHFGPGSFGTHTAPGTMEEEPVSAPTGQEGDGMDIGVAELRPSNEENETEPRRLIAVHA